MLSMNKPMFRRASGELDGRGTEASAALAMWRQVASVIGFQWPEDAEPPKGANQIELIGTEEQAALTLADLAFRDGELQQIIIANEGIPRLLTLIRHGSPLAQEHAARAIMSLADCMEHQKQITVAGAIPAVVQLLQGATPAASARAVGAGVALQLALGAPFLATHPASYLSRAFELTRVFFFKWSVNWAFLPESVFLSKPFALLLLATHLTSLAAFAHWRWTSDDGGLPGAVAGWWASGRGKRARAALAPAHVARAVAAGNFIGIACARSLHYQFYAWYAHTLPLLLWGTRLPVVAKLGLWAVVEAAWNVFPPTPAASLSLLAAHGVLLAALFLAPAPGRALATGKLKRR
jgi:alpha-1,3-mannosyltransferase